MRIEHKKIYQVVCNTVFAYPCIPSHINMKDNSDLRFDICNFGNVFQAQINNDIDRAKIRFCKTNKYCKDPNLRQNQIMSGYPGSRAQ